MGGTSESKTTQSSQLAPYSPATGTLNGLLGSLGSLAGSAGSLSQGQSGALNQVISNSNGQPNYAPQIQSGTYGLLNGGGANNNNGALTSNLASYNSNIGNIANGSMVGKNTALQGQLDTMSQDITNQINPMWAAAGRDGSPGNAQALARGIAQAEAPVIAAQYNQDVQNQLAASGALYGAGNSTYGMLNQNQAQANQNFQNGVGTISAGLNAENAAPTAALNASNQFFNLPTSQLTTLLGAVSPVAAQFGTQNSQSDTQSQMSGAQQFALLMSGLGNLMPKGNISFGT